MKGCPLADQIRDIYSPGFIETVNSEGVVAVI